MSEMRVQVPPSRFTFHQSAMNRLACYFDESTDMPPLGDFVVVFGDFGRFGVSHEVARQIENGDRRPWDNDPRF